MRKTALKKFFVLMIVIVLVFTLFACGTAAIIQEDESVHTESDEGFDNEIPAGERTDTQGGATDEEKAAEQKAFAEFMDASFKKAVEESFLASHIYYIDPEAAGFDMSNTDIGFGLAPDDTSLQEMRDFYDEASKEFVKFNRSLLTPEQQVEYDSFKWELTVSKRLTDKKFDYYEQFFAPPNSLDANIVSYLMTWDIRHEKDAANTVSLVNSVGPYVDSAIEYAKKQQDMGLLMTNFDTVIEGCQDVIDNGMDSSVLAHLLQEIDELDITEEKKTEFKNGITDGFQNSYLPSFQKIIDAMEEMRGGYNNTEGYAAFPNGKEYFEINQMYTTGTLDSAEKIDKYLEKNSDSLLNKLMSVYTRYSDEVTAYYEGAAPSSGYTSYKEILEANKVALLADFPEVKNLEYNIQDADPEEKLSEKNIAAYFLIPPIDGEHLQQMRVEPTGVDVGSLDTFETVSHEGFPGHMYHYAYMYDNIESPYIKSLGVDSFIEGYAVYAQMEAFNYLTDVSDGYKELINTSTALSYTDYSRADIGINYYGWDVTDTLDYFNDIGYSVDETAAQEIFDYLRCTPCTYQAYGYGYLRIADMKARAKEALGDSFTNLDFNTALLKPGAVPFSIIEDAITKYINENE